MTETTAPQQEPAKPKRYGIAVRRTFKRTSKNPLPSAPPEIPLQFGSDETKKLEVIEFEPSILQQQFTSLYLSEEGKGKITPTCRQLKFSPNTAYKWMADPAFVAWFRRQERNYLISLEGLKLSAYRKGLRKGDARMVRLLEERIGNLRAAGVNVGFGVGLGGGPGGMQGAAEVIVTFEIVHGNNGTGKPGPEVRDRA